MATDQSQPDDPLRVFRLGYDAFAWTSMIFVALLTVWIMYTLFTNTPDGTASTRAYIAVQPTLTAIAAGGGGETSGEPPAFSESDAMSLFTNQACTGCHTVEGADDGNLACPPLGLIAATAAERIAAADYAGEATTVEAYIRESIVDPNAYLVEAPAGKVYSAGGNSLMPLDFSNRIDESELDNLVAWLASLE
jgi:mono/diheme cytochrome c family protein